MAARNYSKPVPPPIFRGEEGLKKYIEIVNALRAPHKPYDRKKAIKEAKERLRKQGLNVW